jgi:hypothetical protein
MHYWLIVFSISVGFLSAEPFKGEKMIEHVKASIALAEKRPQYFMRLIPTNCQAAVYK